MNRKFIIAAILILIIPVFALMAFADESGFLKPGGDAEVGEKVTFKINLEPFKDFEPYTVYIKCEPNPEEPILEAPVMQLGSKKNLEGMIQYNPVEDEYYVDSVDVLEVNALSLFFVTDEEIEEPIPYIVRVTVRSGEPDNPLLDEAEFDFLLEPSTKPEPTEPTTEPTKPTETSTAKPTEPTTTTAATKPSKPKHGGFDGGEEEDDKDAYHGSSDNYLRELSVSGQELTQTFHKTRMVYFVDLTEDVSSLDVHAVPCDKGARVDIAGNNNLRDGSGKIVIDVRAVNGDKRTYTIYVRRK